MTHSDELKNVVIRDYATGKYSYRKLAEKYNVHHLTVMKWVKKNGLSKSEVKGLTVKKIKEKVEAEADKNAEEIVSNAEILKPLVMTLLNDCLNGKKATYVREIEDEEGGVTLIKDKNLLGALDASIRALKVFHDLLKTSEEKSSTGESFETLMERLKKT